MIGARERESLTTDDPSHPRAEQEDLREESSRVVNDDYVCRDSEYVIEGVESSYPEEFGFTFMEASSSSWLTPFLEKLPQSRPDHQPGPTV
jgi:hypothetical protein